MKNSVIIIAGLIGLLSGLAAADYNESQTTYCEEIEQQVKDRNRLNGTLACVDPSTTDMDLGSEAQSQLKCSCMILQNGTIQFINIGTA